MPTLPYLAPLPRKRRPAAESLTAVGLFAGIGGIELGLHRAGHASSMLCEIDGGARAVLETQFPEVLIERDVRGLERIPRADILAAGFPCQDLSQAGNTAGIHGRNSGLVGEVFRLLSDKRRALRWLVLENVPFMLQLDGGQAMSFLVRSLERHGFRWAYRVVEARAFGLPQRRKRVILVASRSEDPSRVLFADEAGAPPDDTDYTNRACGFYWTEGTRGLGWAVDAVPTLKGGSTIGIPSPPAIWMPDGRIVTPDIRDAERLQGFPFDWTLPAVEKGGAKASARWKLVGNAVSVPLFEWVGERLARPGNPLGEIEPLDPSTKWPDAAFGSGGRAFRARLSQYPLRRPTPALSEFLNYAPRPLSVRSTSGFLRRAEASRLRFVPGFLEAMRRHLATTDVVRRS